jgi:hypothetical protein
MPDFGPMDQPDLIHRLQAGRLARELLDEFLAAGKNERAMGLVIFCDRLGVCILTDPLCSVNSDKKEH